MLPISWGDSVRCEVQAVFEGDPGITQLTGVKIVEKETGTSPWNAFTLEKRDAWQAVDFSKRKTDVKDISAYTINAPVVDGYVCVVDEPYAYTEYVLGSLIYKFTVYYVKQSEALKLHISKAWEKTDDSTVYPDKIKLTVKRDGDVDRKSVV